MRRLRESRTQNRSLVREGVYKSKRRFLPTLYPGAFRMAKYPSSGCCSGSNNWSVRDYETVLIRVRCRTGNRDYFGVSVRGVDESPRVPEQGVIPVGMSDAPRAPQIM